MHIAHCTLHTAHCIAHGFTIVTLQNRNSIFNNKDLFKKMNNLILLEYSTAINVIHTPVASKNGADFISGSHSLED